MAEVVGRHDSLVSVGGVPPPRAGAVDIPMSAGVVDEEVNVGKLMKDFPGEPLDVGLRGQVEGERVDLGVARCADNVILGSFALAVKILT